MNFGDLMSRYNSFHEYFYNKFNSKILKLSIDAGLTCPNRDGTLGSSGCIYCSERGAGDFTFRDENSILDQMSKQRKRLETKWPEGLNIAFFQSFTNTYADIETLRKIYYAALSYENTVGLAIATRADCLSDKVLDLLSELNEKTFLWIELGMQSVNEETIGRINRGYSHAVFDDAIDRLKERGLKTLAHIIFGLPGESKKSMMEGIKYIDDKKLFGIKIHSLYIQEDTPLAKAYIEEPFELLSKDEYTDLVVEAISKLSPEIVIHRLTGDPNKKKLIAPKWTADKLSVLSGIEKKLKEKNISQGCNL